MKRQWKGICANFTPPDNRIYTLKRDSSALKKLCNVFEGPSAENPVGEECGNTGWEVQRVIAQPQVEHESLVSGFVFDEESVYGSSNGFPSRKDRCKVPVSTVHDRQIRNIKCHDLDNRIRRWNPKIVE
jgi:hypothetical protein